MNERPAVRAGRPRAVLSFAGIIVLGGAALWCWWRFAAAPTSEELISRARAALARQDYGRAQEIVSRIGRESPAWGSARLIAGEAAFRTGRAEDAIRFYASVPRDGSPASLLAALAQAEVCRDLGRLSDAEGEYAYVLKHEPGNAEAHDRMAFLLGVTGRRWNSLEHFMFLVRSGNLSLETLALLGDLERPMEQAEYLRRCAENAPEDVLVLLGLAAHAVGDGSSSEARRLLRTVVARAPELVAAQAMLGELIVDADDEAFAAWHAGVPRAGDDYPDIWYVRGLRARRLGKLEVAARCFWETVRLAPTHRRGTYQLGQVLVSLAQTSGREFSERSSQLFELTRALDDALRSSGGHEPTLRKIADLMESTGRLWEAWAWAALASDAFPTSAWPRKMAVRLLKQLRADTPQVIDSENLALKYDLSRLPGFESVIGKSGRHRTYGRAASTPARIRFEQESGTGMDFVYANGADGSTRGARTFEQNGGGVAVLDFDGDRWPDVYFTQGAVWVHGAREPTVSPELTDRLYRNIAGRAFADVTQESGLGDSGFGQGCAVGDFDNDGFADVYVANVGRNRLYRNSGDGTFSDVTDSAGIQAADWTASCVIADLNGDALPDLFDVNYLTGPKVYELICDGKACSPKAFDGTPNRLLLNRGDGGFAFAAEAIAESSGKGLGVVAVDLKASGRPGLFIANDQVANALLQSSPTDDTSGFRLQDHGFVSGLAFNENGLAMACMGIAADDADGNGLIDFFVTNFHNESNTLYLQDAPGLFVDATSSSGLSAPSWPFVGWGTQFLDADLDGEPDLVVANGHVDDYRDEGGEYHMRPQFFRNTRGGRFVELFADAVGEYFGRKYLARGLARLDWNRDGRMDFVVSNIGERASLVTNESTGTGHFLNVRLHATRTARDAIGTIVEVTTEDRRWTKQLVAGDGYMASNERVLQFGLGEADIAKELRVKWPSGETTVLHDQPVNVTLQLIEGSPRVIRW